MKIISNTVSVKGQERQNKQSSICNSCNGKRFYGNCLPCAVGFKTDSNMALHAGDYPVVPFISKRWQAITSRLLNSKQHRKSVSDIPDT